MCFGNFSSLAVITFPDDNTPSLGNFIVIHTRMKLITLNRSSTWGEGRYRLTTNYLIIMLIQATVSSHKYITNLQGSLRHIFVSLQLTKYSRSSLFSFKKWNKCSIWNWQVNAGKCTSYHTFSPEYSLSHLCAIYQKTDLSWLLFPWLPLLVLGAFALVFWATVQLRILDK